ncbi:MAG TPA: hypothetical protein VGP93_19920, partial [Polyangiaceae bacterium]|nr:hypothetical protein [Polyangiaceae bacterium]
HGYWDQPELAAAGTSPAFTIENTSQLALAEHGTLARLASFRLSNKPFVVSEYAEAAPNDFVVEGLPLLATIASFQDWDGLFPYALLDQRADFAADHVLGFFDLAGHPAKLAFLPLAALAFRRELVQPGPSLIELSIGRRLAPAPTEEAALSTLWSKNGLPGGSIAVRRLGVRLLDSDANAAASHLLGITPPLTSETREIIWDAENKKPRFLLNAPAVKLAVGFLAGERLALGSVEFDLAPTSNGFAAVGLIALDGQDLAHSRRALLVTAGRAENTDMRFTRDRHSLESWGRAPVRAERVRLALTLEGSGWRANAVELDGSRAGGEIQGGKAAERTRLDLGTGSAGLWYLLER